MPRVKRGVQHVKHRKKIYQKTRGFIAGRKNTIRLAKTAGFKAGAHAFVGRKNKKRVYRGLWQIRISAAVKPFGLSYSKFMGGLKKQNIALDRKILAELAVDHPEVFAAVVAEVKK